MRRYTTRHIGMTDQGIFNTHGMMVLRIKGPDRKDNLFLAEDVCLAMDKAWHDGYEHAGCTGLCKKYKNAKEVNQYIKRLEKQTNQ